MRFKKLLTTALVAFVSAVFPALSAEQSNGNSEPQRLGVIPAPQPDPTGIDKCKFVSLVAPSGGVFALRVNLTSLHHVDPPYTGGVTVAFTAFEGLSVWVGPPTAYPESSSNPFITFLASFTQCQPEYRDWSTVGLLHITGSAVVPSSIYHVETVDVVCQGVEGSVDCQPGGANVSTQLEIRTTRWGDVELPFSASSDRRQPDSSDISAEQKKFRDIPGALIKARAFIAISSAFGEMNTLPFGAGLAQLSTSIDAFRGRPYPGRMGRCSGSGTSACTTASDCTSGGNTGPCNLYCP